MTNVIASLSELLDDLSDGEWEHGMGISLESLDNPGWALRICISGTRYEELDVPPQRIDRSDADWVHVLTSQEGHDRYLKAYCGVGNLQEAAELVFDVLKAHGGRAS